MIHSLRLDTNKVQDKKLELDKTEISNMKQYILKLTDDHMKVKKEKDAKILEIEKEKDAKILELEKKIRELSENKEKT